MNTTVEVAQEPENPLDWKRSLVTIHDPTVLCFYGFGHDGKFPRFITAAPSLWKLWSETPPKR